MRILYIVHQFYPEFSGGTERVTLNLAEAMQRAGHQVHVLTCATRDAPAASWPSKTLLGAWEMAVHGVTVTFLPRSAWPAGAEIGFDTDSTLADRLQRWMAGRRFQVVHVMHAMRVATAIRAVQQANIPYVITLTDFFLPCHQINLVNVAGQECAGPAGGERCARDCLVATWGKSKLAHRYAQARAIVEGAAFRCCPSADSAKRLGEAFPAIRFEVIPHGLNLLGMPSIQTRTARRESALVLAYAGTINRQKGLDVLLRGFARVQDDRLQLWVMGPAHGGGVYQREIDALIDLDPRVQRLGELTQAEVFERLGSCDVLCLPSRVPETFSLTFHEAMALGVPSLVSDLGAPAEVVRESGAGRAVAAGSAAAWAEAIEALIEHPEALAAWKHRLPIPLRIEEEGFFYESLYRSQI